MRNEVIKAVKRGDGAKIIAWFKKKYPELETHLRGYNSQEDRNLKNAQRKVSNHKIKA